MGGFARVFQAALLLCVARLLLSLRGSKTRLVWCSSEPNVLIRKILAHPNFRSVRYSPTWFGLHPMLNIALYILKVRFQARCHGLRRHLLRTPDKASIALDFFNTPQEQLLPATAPLLIFLHTITGNARDTAYFMKEAVERGWRPVVLNRRGHGDLALETARFNIMGEADDTHLQVMELRRMYPQAWMTMVGLSAGSGLLITYLGKYANETPIAAACSLCPAYDISVAFKTIGETFFGRLCEKHILKSMKDMFLRQNFQLLAEFNSHALQRCLRVRTIHEFIVEHVPFALQLSSRQGENSTSSPAPSAASNFEVYMNESNPMRWAEKIKIPVLVLNSQDDMVCKKENIREDLALSSPGFLLVVCDHGSHLGFNEGLWGQRCFMTGLTLDFLEAAHVALMT